MELSQEQTRAMETAWMLVAENVDTSVLRLRLQRRIAAALLEARADGMEKHLCGFTCTCHEAYRSRGMQDPDCRYHDVEEDATKDAELLRREAQQLREPKEPHKYNEEEK